MASEKQDIQAIFNEASRPGFGGGPTAVTWTKPAETTSR